MISTMRDSRSDNRHHFLLLTYTELDFLINRDQLCASLFLERIDEFACAAPAISGTMEYRHETVPIFDFDTFLHRHFQCSIDSLVKFALICELSAFSPAFQTAFHALIGEPHPELSPTYIALTVGSQAQIIQIPLREIHLIPGSLRKTETEFGVLGCRFPETSKIQYFLDIETILRNDVLEG